MFFYSSDYFINIGDFRMIVGELVEIIAMIVCFFVGSLLVYLDRECSEDKMFFGMLLIVLGVVILIFVIIRIIALNETLILNWWNTEVW